MPGFLTLLPRIKKCLPLALVAGSLLMQSTTAAGGPGDIIPRPRSVDKQRGSFTLNTSAVLVARGHDARQVAGMLGDQLEEDYGLRLPLVEESTSRNRIVVAIKPGSLQAEGYRLQVTPRGISLESPDAAGLFHGIQTILELLGPAKAPSYRLDAVTITDYPRFSYRGMHLDCGRHFFPVTFIKRYLDLMARYKFNTFHWHLTEDQGWRIEIKKYPRLTTLGSRRAQTVVGHNTEQYDSKPYSGYYTQQQIKEVVRYAQARHITIIPEIEMPGHSLAALHAYPLLGCGTGPYQTATRWGVFPDVYCAGKESTFQFLQNVLDEVMELFPGRYIHIGGDECPKTRWKQCPYCQQRIGDLGLKGEEGLQSYFIKRIEKYLNDHGRAIIGWDEILEGGLAPGATVMSWRGEKGGIAAATQHHDVIMTPGSWCYFDHAQSHSPAEPLNFGGYLPLSRVYGYDPVPAALPAGERSYIKGVQANLWSEYIPTVSQLEYMIMPRMLAMAEVGWTEPERKDFSDFSRRLSGELAYLDRKGVHFRIPEPAGLLSDTTREASVLLKLEPPVPGTAIYYTLDGSRPTVTSRRYTAPIRIDLSASPRVKVQLIEVTPSGNQSIPYEATYVRSEP